MFEILAFGQLLDLGREHSQWCELWQQMGACNPRGSHFRSVLEGHRSLLEGRNMLAVQRLGSNCAPRLIPMERDAD